MTLLFCEYEYTDNAKYINFDKECYILLSVDCASKYHLPWT